MTDQIIGWCTIAKSLNGIALNACIALKSLFENGFAKSGPRPTHIVSKLFSYTCRHPTQATPFLCRMPSQTNSDDRVTILQGTLDLLILKTLVLGECHGQGIARSILRQSEEAFFVDHGSLYLALQRLEDKKWISAKWGVSANNRKARFYSLTAKGR